MLVEGDEEKRYARYIELRAEQLSRENEASKPKPDQYEESALFTSTISDVQPALNDQSELISDLTGTYVSDIQRGPPWMFFDRKPWFTFEQSGNDIIGTDVSKNGSKIYGIRNGDTIKFKYWGRFRLIVGRWEINPDGTSLKGTWEADNEHGSWNLTRIE